MYRDSVSGPTVGQIVKIGSIVVGVLVLCVGTGLWGCPAYSVYAARKHGEAQLAEAYASKQVSVQTSKAKLESAGYEADAEVRRAVGVRDANRIIADGLGGPEGYLRYLYINTLEHTQNQIIYLPTEAGLPILEAGRHVTNLGVSSPDPKKK